jgi:phage shock protein A
MIVRGLRSPSRIKAETHKNHHQVIQDLQKQNKELRLQVLKAEQRLIEAQQSKRKYKAKYREAKQKIDILGLVGGLYSQKQQQMDHYEGCNSPRTKATRIKTAS